MNTASSLSIRTKQPEVTTTIFTVMSRLANESGAINLSQGFPDFPIDEGLVKLVSDNMYDGHNQYAPMGGVPLLREAISRKVEKTYGRKYNPETEITVTAGATQAIYTAITALVHPGDEVIVFTPAYDCYVPAIKLNGGIPKFCKLLPPRYGVDWEQVEKTLSDKTALVIINTPHNPTGTIWNKDDLLNLERLSIQYGFHVLSDEVYEHIVFDGARHESVTRFEALASRSFAVSSFGKTFHATGWKMGYICGPEELMAEFRKVHQYLVFSVNTPIQYALAAYIEEPGNYRTLGTFYQEKRDLFLSEIQGSGFEPLPCQGTYFQLLSYRSIHSKPDLDYAKDLTLNGGVASIPLSVFYEDSYDGKVLRFCFAKEETTLRKAGELLRKI